MKKEKRIVKARKNRFTTWRDDRKDALARGCICVGMLLIFLGFPLVGIPQIPGLSQYLSSWNDALRDHVVDIILEQFASAALILSIIAVLSDKSNIILWEDAAERNLIKPVGMNLVDVSLYTVIMLVCSIYYACTNGAFFTAVLAAVEAVSLGYVIWRILRIYFKKDSIRRQILREYEKKSAYEKAEKLKKLYCNVYEKWKNGVAEGIVEDMSFLVCEHASLRQSNHEQTVKMMHRYVMGLLHSIGEEAPWLLQQIMLPASSNKDWMSYYVESAMKEYPDLLPSLAAAASETKGVADFLEYTVMMEPETEGTRSLIKLVEYNEEVSRKVLQDEKRVPILQTSQLCYYLKKYETFPPYLEHILRKADQLIDALGIYSSGEEADEEFAWYTYDLSLYGDGKAFRLARPEIMDILKELRAEYANQREQGTLPLEYEESVHYILEDIDWLLDIDENAHLRSFMNYGQDMANKWMESQSEDELAMNFAFLAEEVREDELFSFEDMDE